MFNAGTKPSLKDNDGVLYQASKTSLEDITDGTTMTLLACETLKGEGQKRAATVERQYVLLTARDALQRINDNSGVKEWKANRNIRGNRCASWMDGGFLQTTFNAARRPNDPRPDVVVDGGYGGLSAVRTLTDVIESAFCDGHVSEIDPNVDAKVWKLFSSRADGKAIPGDISY